MQRRKLLIGVASVASSALLLAACGTGPNPSAAPTPTEDPSGSITFWSSLAGMDKVAAGFNASQSKIKVNFETIPNGDNGGYAKLSTAITAGNGPDVATIEYPQLPQFVSNGQVQPLDGLIDRSATVDKLANEIKGMVQFGGKTYGLPYDAAPMVMYYRKDMLAKAGVGIPKTWQEFEEAGRKLKSVAPNAYLASFNPNQVAATAGLAWQAGAKWFGTSGDSWQIGVNDDPTKKVADYWQKLIDNKIVKVQQAFSDEWSLDLANGTVVGVWAPTGVQRASRSAPKRADRRDNGSLQNCRTGAPRPAPFTADPASTSPKAARTLRPLPNSSNSSPRARKPSKRAETQVRRFWPFRD